MTGWTLNWTLGPVQQKFWTLNRTLGSVQEVQVQTSVQNRTLASLLLIQLIYSTISSLSIHELNKPMFPVLGGCPQLYGSRIQFGLLLEMLSPGSHHLFVQYGVNDLNNSAQEVRTGKCCVGREGGFDRSLNIFFLNDVFSSESLQKCQILLIFDLRWLMKHVLAGLKKAECSQQLTSIRELSMARKKKAGLMFILSHSYGKLLNCSDSIMHTYLICMAVRPLMMKMKKKVVMK